MSTVTTGPSFLSLQVADLDRARDFYCRVLGLAAAPASPPGAQILATAPIAMALRTDVTPAPGTAGRGVTVWIGVEDVDALYQTATAAGATPEGEPTEGPFGRMFTVADPDGYRLTLHDSPR